VGLRVWAAPLANCKNLPLDEALRRAAAQPGALGAGRWETTDEGGGEGEVASSAVGVAAGGAAAGGWAAGGWPAGGWSAGGWPAGGPAASAVSGGPDCQSDWRCSGNRGTSAAGGCVFSSATAPAASPTTEAATWADVSSAARATPRLAIGACSTAWRAANIPRYAEAAPAAAADGLGVGVMRIRDRVPSSGWEIVAMGATATLASLRR